MNRIQQAIHALRNRGILLAGILLGMAFWSLESLLHACCFQGGSFAAEFFPGDPMELWMRAFTSALFVCFGVFAQFMVNRHQQSRAFITAVMDSLPLGVAVNSVDAGVNFSYMNDKFPALYRTTRAALASPDAFWDSVYEDAAFRAEIRQRVMDDCASGDPQRMHWDNVPITRKGAGTTYVNATNTPVPGKPLVISTVLDVTERLRAEIEIKQSHEFNDTLLRTIPFPIDIVDEQGNILFMNELMKQSVGRDATGEQCWGTYKDDRKQCADCPLRQPISVGHTRSVVSEGALGGSTFEIFHTGMWYQGEHALLEVFVNITERQKAQQALRKSEALLLATEKLSGTGGWEYDVQTRKVTFTDGISSIFRTPLKGVADILEFFHPDDKEMVSRAFRAAIDECLPYDIEARVINAQGDERWVRSIGKPQQQDGKVVKLAGNLMDITESKRVEEKLLLASLVYQNSNEAMMVTDASNRIVTVNPAYTRVTGYTLDEVVGRDPKEFGSGRHDRAFFKQMWHTLKAAGWWQGEIWDRRKNGQEYPKLLTINTIFNPDGSPSRYVALFTDISEKKKSEEMIWQQANFDQLTGLPNRRMFHDRLEQEIKQSHRSGQMMALLLLDLDRFKEINDTLGHDMGDVLLKETARRLISCVRETDTVARLGGDEFMIILGELDSPAGIDRVAQDILHQLSLPFSLWENVCYVTASIGITFYPTDAPDIESLLKNADQAMYAAKHGGRNRFRYYTPAMQDAAQARMRLAADLRHALADSQFRLHYQPIVELATGAIHKAEALIRWQHPTRGLVSPAEFIPIAEDTGLIIDIGNWAFREAAHQAMRWRASHHAAFQISVNKSPVQFLSEDGSHGEWFDYLQTLGLPGQGITVEITEGLLLDSNTAVSDKLSAFRDAGMQVSLDDFGTGYSSLAYLKKFDIDYLKIDQSFTRNLTPGSSDMALSEAIIVMAHKLGMKVVAEGVETEQQRDLLKAAGCDYAQGYLFSRPVPAEEFENLLETAMTGGYAHEGAVVS